LQVVILQPGYLPWLGFFDQLDRADRFVLYDDVQFDKGGWRNRNRVKGPNGPVWLTVPILTSGKGMPLIQDVQIDPKPPWIKKHVKTLRQCYGKAPFYEKFGRPIEQILARRHDRLIDLDLELIYFLARSLDIASPMARSSELKIEDADPTRRLVRICRYFEADRYLTGDAAREYLREEEFEKGGIAVEYQNYQHPT